MPFFSIIIPTYNRAHCIRQAIDSVLHQSYEDFEVIVVDDGSTDDSFEQVSNIDDRRLRYLKQHNQGVTIARNHAASIATGEYLLFLDSDDTLKPEALFNHHRVLQNNRNDLSFSDVERKNIRTRQSIIISARNPYRGESSMGLFLAGAFCIRRSLFKQLGGYDEYLKFGENAELQLRLLPLKPSVVYTDAVGLTYELSSTGGASQWSHIIHANKYIMDKHPVFFQEKPHVLKYYRQKIALCYAKLHQYSPARRYMWLAFKAYPRNLKPLFWFLILLFPFISVKLLKQID